VTTLSLALPAVVLTFFALLSAPGASGVSAAAPTSCATWGDGPRLVAYGALFALLGVLLKRPVIRG